MADKTSTPTVEQRMRGQAITFHDLAVSLFANVAEHEGRSHRATERGDYQTSARHLAAAENVTEWANKLMGPSWKEYAKRYAYATPTPPGPQATPSK